MPIYETTTNIVVDQSLPRWEAVSLWSLSNMASNIRRCLLGPTKHRTDRTGGEIAAGKAQINCRDIVINIYTAYHPIHD